MNADLRVAVAAAIEVSTQPEEQRERYHVGAQLGARWALSTAIAQLTAEADAIDTTAARYLQGEQPTYADQARADAARRRAIDLRGQAARLRVLHGTL